MFPGDEDVEEEYINFFGTDAPDAAEDANSLLNTVEKVSLSSPSTVSPVVDLPPLSASANTQTEAVTFTPPTTSTTGITGVPMTGVTAPRQTEAEGGVWEDAKKRRSRKGVPAPLAPPPLPKATAPSHVHAAADDNCHMEGEDGSPLPPTMAAVHTISDAPLSVM